ncbi:MAG: Rieske 2Fe-2S domain-containing protein [Deltaproteobacteria bacterium]|nr:Rieske 2Fe-2S domain-containing protein [Deltaproteobacteria bacterium]
MATVGSRSRREFLDTAWRWVAAAGAALAPLGVLGILSRAGGRPREIVLDPGILERAAREGGVAVEGVYVRVRDGVPDVLSLRCRHLGCRVRPDPARGGFECPCHGSRYGLDGRVHSGPARSDLLRPAVRRSGDRWIVELGADDD